MAPKTLIQNAALAKTNPGTGLSNEGAKRTTTAILNGILDGEGYRKRIEEILGKRAPQFVSSVLTMANNDTMLRKVVASAPQTIITSALKAATLDLPIEPSLGMAYVMPFKNAIKHEDGTTEYRDESTLVIGYKGLVQLAQRTGMYKHINVDVIYEGESIVDDRISGMITIEGEKTSDTPIAYFAYFKLLNGFEKCVCWSKEKVAAHEAKNRKGKYMSKAWRDDFDAMAMKTVLRNLISKWGPLSIDYQAASPEMVKAADSLQQVMNADENEDFIPADGSVDLETGEILHETTEKEGA